jgi:hypothetical protein
MERPVDPVDRRRDVDEEFGDPGTKDFWFGVIGIGTCAVVAIVLGILSGL